MMAEEEETMMPMNEVIAKPRGMVKNCDHKASFGFFANLAKSVLQLEWNASRWPKSPTRVVDDEGRKIRN